MKMESKNIELDSNYWCAEKQTTIDCFGKNICREYSKLLVRLQELQPKRHQRRIKMLARPKYFMSKIVTTNTGQPNCSLKTEIIRELPSLTRTQQLAYPRVRNILPIRENFKHILGDGRLKILNRTIRKSMLSLYSRLANCQHAAEKEPVGKWTKKEWAVHRRHLCKLAQPKKIFKSPKKVHMWKDISIMNRFKYLCKPKERLEPAISKWELTPTLKNYKPTPIIIRLSKKETDETLHQQTLPIKIKAGTLKYKPTERIMQLATRAEKRLGESDLKENPFGVPANALKAKPSDRVVELSQAKEYEQGHIRENPFLISPAALKAKASPRVIELSQPKGTA